MPTSRAVPQAEGWPVSEKAPLPGVGLLSGQQVHHVGLLVDPGAAGVLVEAHGPERDHLALTIGVVGSASARSFSLYSSTGSSGFPLENSATKSRV